MRLKTWTGLCRKSQALPVFDGAESAQGDLDLPLVVPAGPIHLQQLFCGAVVAFVEACQAAEPIVVHEGISW